jgi:ATP-dependent exoDNAse (exonuclease V) alpha subunit
LLTPFRSERHECAADRLNIGIRKLLDLPYDKPVAGDLVVGTKNHRLGYSNHNYLNGEQGIIVEASRSGVIIQFGLDVEDSETQGHLEYFETAELEPSGLPKHISYAYATTIHKAQGGEYPHVIVAVPAKLQFMFGKPALYTACTRAKQSLTLVGAIDKIRDIAANPGERRCTVIKSIKGLPLQNSASQIAVENVAF